MPFLVGLTLCWALTPLGAKAADDACEEARVDNWAEYKHVGFVSQKMARNGSSFFYSSHVTGPNWTIRPYWTPASGILVCEKCAVFGEIFMMRRDDIGDDSTQQQSVYPRSASRRIDSGGEFFRLSTYDRHNINSAQGRNDIRIGPLSGYAVLYFIKKQPPHEPGKPMSGPRYRRLLVVYADDDCAALHVTIGIKEERQQPVWGELEALLAEITVMKSATLALPDDVDIGSFPPPSE